MMIAGSGLGLMVSQLNNYTLARTVGKRRLHAHGATALSASDGDAGRERRHRVLPALLQRSLEPGHLDLVLGDPAKSLALKISFMIGLRRCHPAISASVGTRPVFLSGFGAISVVKMDLPVSRRSKGRGTTAVVVEEADAGCLRSLPTGPFSRWRSPVHPLDHREHLLNRGDGEHLHLNSRRVSEGELIGSRRVFL